MLGPLLLRGADGPVRLGSVRQRRLLTGLAAHLGHAVDVDVLVDLVWEGDPPADPPGAVHTNVARLRRLLPQELRLETTPRGYRLAAARPAVDVTAFADHLAAAAASTDPRVRVDALAEALALWRGRPFCELDHQSLEPEVARLTALRTDAAEQHAEALLVTGHPGEAAAAAEALAAAEPLRESAVAVLMRALVAAGRQGDALAAFAQLRRRLADELGLDPGPQLRELEQQVLRQELAGPPAPARSTDVRPGPVRLPVSSFVGRKDDLARVVEHLARCRVVTLCGPGGVGKTRLARHAAAAVADRYADGAVVVELGDGGPVDVEPLVAAALRLVDGRAAAGGGPGLTDRIVEALAVQSRLVVLDNCEHVCDEVATLVEAVVAGAHGVDLLLTSREPLRVDGEQVLPVRPLAPPAAARLLTDRMRAGDPSAAPEAQADLVAQVCRQLDGLPLALELAAARALPLGLRGLLDTLVDESPDAGPFAVLRGGRRTAARRHRSLRDVVAWSYELLDEDQRRSFDRLSVFAGPVERDAVVSVCGNAEALPDLVERSLVVRQPGEPARFGMLETLRAFGRSRLATDPTAQSLRARHATWAARLADEVTAGRRGPGETAAIRRFDAHLADLRRAHAWLRENGPVDELLRLTVPAGELAYLRGRVDLVRMLADTIDATGGTGAAGVAHPLRARLLGLLATTGWQQGELATAERHARLAIGVAEAAGDPAAGRDGFEAWSNVLSFRGDLVGARHRSAVALDLALAVDDTDTAVGALTDRTIQAAYAGDDDASSRHEAELARLVARTGSATGRAFLAYARGERRAELGDRDAGRHLEEAVRVADEAGLWFVAGIARHTLVTRAARDAADPAAAIHTFGPLIDHWRGFGAWTQLWMALRALIETLSRAARHPDVAVLLGALQASPRASRIFGSDSARMHDVARAARTVLGAEFEVLRERGAVLGDSGAVALAGDLVRG